MTSPRSSFTLFEKLPPTLLLIAGSLTLVIAFTLRIWHAKESLWIDELHTSWTVSQDFPTVWERATYGNQSPLYFWLEWIVLQSAGTSEIAVRGLSLASGLLLLITLFFLAQQVSLQLLNTSLSPSTPEQVAYLTRTSCWVGLLAAWLATWDGLLLFYAQEARPYALLQWIIVLQQLAAFRWLQFPTPWRLLGGLLLMAVAVLLHPTAILVFLPQVIYLLVQAVRRGDQYREAFAFTLLTLAGSLLLQGPSLLKAISHRDDWNAFIDPPAATELLTLLPGFAWGLFPLTLFGVEKLRSLASGQSVPARSRAALQQLLPIILWMVVPVLVCWIVTRLDIARLWMPRYMSGSIPAISLLIAVMVSLVPGRKARTLAGITLAIVLPLLSIEGPARKLLAKDFSSDRQEEWRGAIAHLKELRTSTQAEAPLFVDSGLIETQVLGDSKETAQDREYGILPVRSLYDPGIRALTFPLPYGKPGSFSDSTWRKVKTSPRLFLLTRSSPEKGARVVSQFVVPWKEAGRSVKIFRHYTSAGVQLYRIDLATQNIKSRPASPYPAPKNDRRESLIAPPANGCQTIAAAVMLEGYNDRGQGSF